MLGIGLHFQTPEYVSNDILLLERTVCMKFVAEKFSFGIVRDMIGGIQWVLLLIAKNARFLHLVEVIVHQYKRCREMNYE